MGRKRKVRDPGPVENGHDRRAEEPENDGSGREREPSAPDGISGDWK